MRISEEEKMCLAAGFVEFPIIQLMTALKMKHVEGIHWMFLGEKLTVLNAAPLIILLMFVYIQKSKGPIHLVLMEKSLSVATVDLLIIKLIIVEKFTVKNLEKIQWEFREGKLPVTIVILLIILDMTA